MDNHYYYHSNRLNNLSYAIRGPIFDKAQELEAAGIKVTNLNIGNPAPFGFDVPDAIIHDMINNLRAAQGYSHHLGIVSARNAVMHHTRQQGVKGVTIEDIFIGNGVSELIMMSIQAIVNDGDEILVPSPDYPLWTTAIALCGGKPVHYICDEKSEWNPDVKDMASKVTSKTKGIVLINPNNPTGAVYDHDVLQEIIKLATKNKLIIFSDEIYDKILYDDNVHIPLASLTNEVLIFTFGGLSKNYRAAGFRGGWLYLSGLVSKAKNVVEGINLLASMRLCANVPTQYTIQTALEGYQCINDLVSKDGRLAQQRDLIYQKISDIPGLSCVKPKGALYIFPEMDLNMYNFKDDNDMAYRLLQEKHVLIVPGSGFNHFDNHHFRIVFLPNIEVLHKALLKIHEFFIENLK